MATVGVALLHVFAGLAIWAGAAITGAPLTIGAALAGALNSAPIAWLAVGAAAFAVGWLPSAVVAIGALPVAGGFLMNVVSQSARRAGLGDEAVAVRPPRRRAQCAARPGGDRRVHRYRRDRWWLSASPGYSRRDLTT